MLDPQSSNDVIPDLAAFRGMYCLNDSSRSRDSEIHLLLCPISEGTYFEIFSTNAELLGKF